MNNFHYVRELTENEKGILRAALLDGIPGVHELRAQAEVAWVADDAAAPTISLGLPEDVRKASLQKNLLPVAIEEISDDGEYLGEVLIWLDDGKLSLMEYGFVVADDPDELPDAARLRFRHAEPKDGSVFDF